MAGSINKTILMGHVGKEPEIRYTQTGSMVASFSLATSESWTDKGGQKQERTEWHRVVAMGKLAGTIKDHVRKGVKLYIEGKLQTKKWTDKKGTDHYTTEVMLGYGSQLMFPCPKSQNQAGEPAPSEGDYGDLPF